MSKIYTKSGDDGTTGLLSNRRVFKDDLRIDAYGTVDELNAALGVARAPGFDAEPAARAARVPDALFAPASALGDPDPAGPFPDAIGPAHVEHLERAIDAMEAGLPPLRRF